MLFLYIFIQFFVLFLYQVYTKRSKNVSTSLRRHDVATTLEQRYFGVLVFFINYLLISQLIVCLLKAIW